MSARVIVVPFFGQGHLFPTIELCKHLASRNIHTTLVISSDLSSSIPSHLRVIPLIHIYEISAPLFLPPPPSPSPSHGPEPMNHHHQQQQMGAATEDLLLSSISSSPPLFLPPPPSPSPSRSPSHGPEPMNHHHHHQQQQMGAAIEDLLLSSISSSPPLCAIIDVMMSWTKGIFHKFNIPIVSFFTSGACSAAMEYASWKAEAHKIKPGQVIPIPGLPEDMALTYSDLQRGPHSPPAGRPGPPAPGGGPPGPPPGPPPQPGQQPMWVGETAGSIALMINTSDDLESPFIEYVGQQTGIPVWGVGPLLPEQYWKSSGPVLHDRDVRPNKKSNRSEEEVIQWLDSKPTGSVIYVSFGSEVGPTTEGYAQLALALEASNRPFIWTIQAGSSRFGPPQPQSQPPGSETTDGGGYDPEGLDLEEKVGERGMIIRGWAPQLMILSHPSTGGFLSHCGWNSTVEGIGRGVAFLAWPIRGDQHLNAMLLVKHLKMGYMLHADASQNIRKEAIVSGIEKLMSDKHMKKRAEIIRHKFGNAFPESSSAALDAFRDFIINQFRAP